LPSTAHCVIIFEPNVHLESELMLPMDIISEALSKGHNTLNEYDAKRFLSSFGIPVCREIRIRPGGRLPAI